MTDQLETDMAAAADAIAKQSGAFETFLGPALAAADAKEREAQDRPTQDDLKRISEADRIMAAEVETSLLAGFMDAWRKAHCPPIGRGDLSALHAIQKVAGHFAQRGREISDITKARAA